MTNNIENIYSVFRATNLESPELVLDFYERNAIYLNNIRELQDKDGLQKYIEIIGIYADSVYRKDRFNLAIEIVDKQQLFIDHEIKRLNAEELKGPWYDSIIFVKGMASYYLKDYKTSTKIFKLLLKSDDQNDNFKRWLTYSQYGKNLWLVRLANIVCIASISIEMIFDSQINNPQISQLLLATGLLGFLGTSGYEYYIKRSFKKEK